MMRLAAIYRHPVKSIGSEALDGAALEVDAPFPGDRRYAIAHAGGAWREGDEDWMACSNFLRVANAPKLAAIEIAYDPATRQLRAAHADAGTLHADLSTEAGRAALAAWIAPLAGPLPAPFRIAEIAAGAFTDSDDMVPSIMSLASLRELSERMGTALDPRRFRGNLWIDGAAPWAELGWQGRDIRIGGATLRVTEAIPRCRATMANPETGARDADPLGALERHYSHTLFGVEAKVVRGGTVAIGDTAALA